MGRGGARKERDGPERRCAATGSRGGTAGLIRFVQGPDGRIVPDLAEKLPGRGVWVAADRGALSLAVKKNAFARSLKRAAVVDPELAASVEALLASRAISLLSIARKAGLAVAGFEKVRAKVGMIDALVQAFDGAEDGTRRMRRLFSDTREITSLSRDELGLAFGRPYVIHVALTAGGATERFVREASRLQGVRERPGRGDGGSDETIDRMPASAPNSASPTRPTARDDDRQPLATDSGADASGGAANSGNKATE